MEAPEVPLEKSQEHIHEHARESGEKWVMGVALVTAIFAAAAAIASLLAGQHINEGMICQIQASDQWALYQAKGIKAEVLDAKMELLAAQKTPGSVADVAKAAQYKKDQALISAKAEALESDSREHIKKHEKLAGAVTFFQIAIAISAIAVLTKKRMFWYVGICSGVVGMAELVMALR
jgi:hypothetical protein